MDPATACLSEGGERWWEVGERGGRLVRRWDGWMDVGVGEISLVRTR